MSSFKTLECAKLLSTPCSHKQEQTPEMLAVVQASRLVSKSQFLCLPKSVARLHTHVCPKTSLAWLKAHTSWLHCSGICVFGLHADCQSIKIKISHRSSYPTASCCLQMCLPTCCVQKHSSKSAVKIVVTARCLTLVAHVHTKLAKLVCPSGTAPSYLVRANLPCSFTMPQAYLCSAAWHPCLGLGPEAGLHRAASPGADCHCFGAGSSFFSFSVPSICAARLLKIMRPAPAQPRLPQRSPKRAYANPAPKTGSMV